MRATTAYFVGAGTIVAAIAIGLGGGIVAGNIMNPIPPKQGPEPAKQERRAEAPSAATRSTAWNESAKGIPYVAGSQAMIQVFDQPAQTESQAATGTVAPATQQQAAAPADPQRAVVSANARPEEPARSAAPDERASAPENAYAKANDADVKRAAAEQRRAERRKQWAERRRHEMREPRAARDRTDWDDVARNVREDSDSRDWASGPRGFPQVRLFGPDGD